MFRNLSILVLVLAVFCAFVWATDTVTLQGERTIYTARCEQGSWQGELCTGKLVAAERYRYRVLKPHNEIFFWIAGSSEPSGKFTDCVIQDGRNWRCQSNQDASRSITLEMARGYPVADPSGVTRPFHAVSKLTWELLNVGIAVTNTAMSPPRPPSSGQAQASARRLAP